MPETPGIVWLPPASGVIEPTKVQVKTPNLAPGRYGTPDGWLDVTEQNDPSEVACPHGSDPLTCFRCLVKGDECQTKN